MTEPHSCCELRVLTSGQGDPLVFIHGMGRSAASWFRQTERLAKRYSTLAVDLPGHGATGTSEDPGCYRREVVFDAVDRVVGHRLRLVAGRPTVVGHSMGGYLSLAYALTRPSSVGALVLISTGPGFGNEERRLRWNERALGSAATYGVAPAAAALGVIPDRVVIEGLHRIAVPALIIVGEDDHTAYLKGAERIAAAIPMSTLVGVPGGGHLVHETDPDAVNDAIEVFLRDMRVDA